jgi:hypothetical protein
MQYAEGPRRCLSVAHDATRPYHEHNSLRAAQHNQDPITLISAGMTTNGQGQMVRMSFRLRSRDMQTLPQKFARLNTRVPDAFTRRHSAVDHDRLAKLPLRFPRKAGDDNLV